MCAHYGVSYIVAHLRQRFHIPKMRQTVKNVIKDCMTCRKQQGKPYDQGHGLPALPKSRVIPSEPFETTGVDFTGALHVKELQTKDDGFTLRWVNIKAYIVLFTCPVTRAIHLELIKDQTTETFFRAFRRFCGRKKYPKLMMSDNAPYFTASAGFLMEMGPKNKEIEKFRDSVKCDWKFIPARAPWFGAIWERCIGTLKGGLYKILGRALVSYDELNTILVELESIINDRPLTYASGDLADMEEITPSKLMTGRRNQLFPDCSDLAILEDPDYVRQQSTIQNLRARNAYLSNIISDFTKRWSHEYLTSLREFQSRGKGKMKEWPKKGDIVLIPDEKHRRYWKMGRVTELLGEPEGCKVVRVKSQGGSTVRPVAKIYPLELQAQEDLDNARDRFSSEDTIPPGGGECPPLNQTLSTDEGVRPPDGGKRPPRKTALASADLWRAKIKEGLV